MITLICFLLTIIGSINWLCIGLLQYDFVAGLFGSQANVFSRIIYAIIGLSSLVLIYAAIKTKGCIKCNGKKSSDQELKISKKKKQKESTENNVSDNNSQQNVNNSQSNVQQGNIQQTPPQNENNENIQQNQPSSEQNSQEQTHPENNSSQSNQ